MSLTINPVVDNGVKKGSSDFNGGTLKCHCTSNPVEVEISSNVLHNHACGCSKCWRPKGARFSVVGVVPKDTLKVTSQANKLHIVDDKAVIQRHACKDCGVHMFGRIETTNHPFHGLDFIHAELFDRAGWGEPTFAAFVSSVLEAGLIHENEMDALRKRLTDLGLAPYDCLNPALMDAIAAWTARKNGHTV